MNFTLEKSIEILERTPSVLQSLLHGLSEDWLFTNEGGNTWSPYDVIGHLIHGDLTDWIVRVDIILHSEDTHFKPFDRDAHTRNADPKSINELLNDFKMIREHCLQKLKSFNVTETDLAKTGIHPAFGTVTLSQLISTWAVHDLDHIYQISRVMAKQYKAAVGPWIEYLKILKQ